MYRKTLCVLYIFITLAIAHTCIHNEIIKNEPEPVRVPQINVHRTLSNDVPKRAVMSHDPSIYSEPMSILVDTTNLDNDNAYSCYSAGQQITYKDNGEAYTCKAEDVLTSSNRTLLVNMLNEAVSIFEATLSIYPTGGGINIDSGSAIESVCNCIGLGLY